MNQIEPVTQTFEINLMPHRQFDQKRFQRQSTSGLRAPFNEFAHVWIESY